jgi:hypothetical protein
VFQRLAVLLVTGMLLAAQSLAQDKRKEKPRVFPAGRGTLNAMTTSGAVSGWSANSASSGLKTSASGRSWLSGLSSTTVDAHDESMELAKDFGKYCPGVIITLTPRTADYVVALNRESKLKRWPMTNSQILVANRAGDMVQSGSTRSVSNAAKDACEAVLADWVQHGRLEVPTDSKPPTAAILSNDSATLTVSNSDPAPATDDQQRYIKVVNGNGTVTYIPECKQNSTGGCK